MAALAATALIPAAVMAQSQASRPQGFLTDRFGSNEYNQKLSERRANTVKDYLVSKNVQASRIDAEGRGETQPVTKADDCRGAKSAKVIACLQPDRRVDVELTGAKTITGSQ